MDFVINASYVILAIAVIGSFIYQLISTLTDNS